MRLTNLILSLSALTIGGILALMLVFQTKATLADDHQWWTLGGTSNETICRISKFSPADVFGKTEAFGAKIVEKGAGRVNIAVPDTAYYMFVQMANQNGWTYTFFRTESDCKDYLAEQSATERQHEQERNKALAPYR